MREHTQEEDAEINMTPMLDIVFIMLIFFIVTAAFVKEAGMQVEKPLAEMGIQQQLTSVTVAVTADDEIWINRRSVDPKNVRVELARLIAENPRGTIVIQADVEAKAGLTMDVMDAARAAGANRVAISTEDK